jgi:hypothetical protein
MHSDGDVDGMSGRRAKPLTFTTRAIASIYSRAIEAHTEAWCSDESLSR